MDTNYCNISSYEFLELYQPRILSFLNFMISWIIREYLYTWLWKEKDHSEWTLYKRGFDTIVKFYKLMNASNSFRVFEKNAWTINSINIFHVENIVFEAEFKIIYLQMNRRCNDHIRRKFHSIVFRTSHGKGSKPSFFCTLRGTFGETFGGDFFLVWRSRPKKSLCRDFRGDFWGRLLAGLFFRMLRL